MHNDKRNTRVLVPSTPATRSTAWVALLLALVALAVNLADTIRQLPVFTGGDIVASLPMDATAAESLVAGWQGEAHLAGTVFADVVISGAPTELANEYAWTVVASGVLSLAIATLIVLAAILLLLKRLSWSWMARTTLIAGAVMAPASLVIQIWQANVSDLLSVRLSGDAPWLEPGFFAGLDVTPALIGVGLVIIGWSLTSSARLAEEADGVV